MSKEEKREDRRRSVPADGKGEGSNRFREWGPLHLLKKGARVMKRRESFP